MFTRRDIWALELEQAWHPITLAYATAVREMQARPADLPTSWDYQAAIHGRVAVQERPGWNQCQHGGWFFLPWHRWYLYHFEGIVREVVSSQGGPADWALPYWDYDGGGDSNRLPNPFREPTLPDGSPNPLFVAARRVGLNDGTEGVPAAVRSSAFAMAQPVFRPGFLPGVGMVRPAFGGDVTLFQHFWDEPGALERTPHNDLHVFVGAGGLMSDPNQAALDPIFWLHHANIDRLWAHWPGAVPDAPWWLDQTFSFFDKDGNQVSSRNGDAVEIEAQLDYTYDDLVAPGPTGLVGGFGAGGPIGGDGGTQTMPEMLGATDRTLELAGEPTTVSVRVDAPQAAPGGLAEQKRTFLSVEHLDADAPPGVVYAVYVSTGRAGERTYVGNVSMFGLERVNKAVGTDRGNRNVRLVFDVTDVLADLTDGEAADVEVTFEPIAGEGAVPGAALTLAETGPQIRVGRVSFFTE